jgi:hypothetical protein
MIGVQEILQTSLRIYKRELIRIMKTLSYNLSDVVNSSSACPCSLYVAAVLHVAGVLRLLNVEVIWARILVGPWK